MVFEVVSAFSTTGLSLSYTTQLTSFGLCHHHVVHVVGTAGHADDGGGAGRKPPPERVEYPEERLLLG